MSAFKKPSSGWTFRWLAWKVHSEMARVLLAEQPNENPATGTMEFALIVADGYSVMVSALDAP